MVQELWPLPPAHCLIIAAPNVTSVYLQFSGTSDPGADQGSRMGQRLAHSQKENNQREEKYLWGAGAGGEGAGGAETGNTVLGNEHRCRDGVGALSD